VAASAAVAAPAVAGTAAYGAHVHGELSEAHAASTAELQSTAAEIRATMQAEMEAHLQALRTESELIRGQILQAGEQLREVTSTMVDRIDGAAFEIRDELNQMLARLRGESDERLDVLEDHLRAAVERARADIAQATDEALERIRQSGAAPGLDGPRVDDGGYAGPSFFISPESSDDDDIDFG